MARSVAPLLRRLGLALLVATVLAGIFWAYLDPHTVLDLGNRVWSCFG